MRRSLIATTSLALCLLCADAAATTVDPPSSDALLREAGFIFEGRVRAVDPAFGGSGDARTRVVVQVLDVLAGSVTGPGQFFDFILPEGRLHDGRFVELIGAPRFAVGERYLVFYRKRAWHHTPVVGWSFGVLRRVPDTAGDRWVDVFGRCVAGLDRHGFVLGPVVGDPAPSPPGWPDAMPSPEPRRDLRVADTCATAAQLRSVLVHRLAELGYTGSEHVHRSPRGGVWIETPASARAGDAP